ncbi:MAG: MerR family transcriptional regulator [Ruminococcus sp.]|nr:MerR family transcriptional regulator [Ruminococcus sp.]
MTIKEVCSKFDISPDTLRYYERVGVIPEVNRNARGIRDYTDEDIKWVETAICFRSAGMPIELLIEYVRLFREGDNTFEARCSLLKEARERILVERKTYNDALEKMNYKIKKYEEAVKTGVLVWDNEKCLNDEKSKYANKMMFPIGDSNDAFSQYFVGRSYLAPISDSQVGIFNVTFEPKCRNNWHIHNADKGGGQILLCIAGRGYYQEFGKDAVEMNPGDCINIHAGVKHWHGAAPDSWFSHLAIEVPGENNSTEWCEAVTDEQYNKLK